MDTVSDAHIILVLDFYLPTDRNLNNGSQSSTFQRVSLVWSQSPGWRWSPVSNIACSQVSNSLFLLSGFHWRDDTAIFLSRHTLNIQHDHGTPKTWENPLWSLWCTVLEKNTFTILLFFPLPNESQVLCKINYCKFHGTNFEKCFTLYSFFSLHIKIKLFGKVKKDWTHIQKRKRYNS